MLLPRKHWVSDLIIKETHIRNLHAGIQTTLCLIRGRFWLIGSKNQVRKIISHCIECIKARPVLHNAPMGDLPKSRLEEAYSFENVGVNYFGPIGMIEKKFHNRTILKSYGCVFVCICKAVHIELASDLSTDAFLAAFRRFISRRGMPSNVYSDNGTNFVGAHNQLNELYKLINSKEFQNFVSNFALSHRIVWHFSPPMSSHFGGLWEAAVKSFKHHFKRVLKNQLLTFKQLNTLLIEIEAILNSRPLCSLSSDPNDPQVLTPANLLTGRPLKALPKRNELNVSDNRLCTWRFIVKARQDFWSRWYKEYLNELQKRQKWNHGTVELFKGFIVILIEKISFCSQWPLAIIQETYPGSDGIIRVVDV